MIQRSLAILSIIGWLHMLRCGLLPTCALRCSPFEAGWHLQAVKARVSQQGFEARMQRERALEEGTEGQQQGPACMTYPTQSWLWASETPCLFTTTTCQARFISQHMSCPLSSHEAATGLSSPGKFYRDDSWVSARPWGLLQCCASKAGDL